MFSFLSPLLLLLAASAPQTLAQDTADMAQFQGTWSSGSKNVLTGPGFANPATLTFTYPKTTGISYSFTETGFYEIARYRFNSNGSVPSCITGVINWVHGTYTLLTNGSIVMTPFGDGYQQIQDPCGANSNFIQNYNETELYTAWAFVQDPVDGTKLQLYQYNGAPLAPMFPITSTPIMLPTQPLRNVTPAETTTDGFPQTGTRRMAKRNGAESILRSNDVFRHAVVAVTSLLGVGMVAMLL